MANIREIIVDWSAAGNAGGVTVFHTLEGSNTASVDRLNMSTFLAALNGLLVTTTVWTIRTEGRVLDNATGGLVGAWAEATARTGTGTAGTSAVSNASQLLVRWTTDTIINGRFLRGRTYIPGCTTGVLVQGQVSSAAQTTVNNAAGAWTQAASQPYIWHRPTNGVGGSGDTAVTGTAWTEMAVLRKRRS